MARSTKLRRLTASAIQNAKPTTTPLDGCGLQLIMTSATSRRLAHRYTIRDDRKVMGLGKYPLISLDTARDLAAKFRKQINDGIAPQLERKAERGRKTSFRGAFNTYFEHKKKTLTNRKHIAQWTSTMEAYVFPKIGMLSIADITGKDIVQVLKPIWHTKPETASRVLQRMDTVFRAAIFHDVPAFSLDLGVGSRSSFHFLSQLIPSLRASRLCGARSASLDATQGADRPRR